MRKTLTQPVTIAMFLLVIVATLYFGLNPPPSPPGTLTICPSNAIEEVGNPDMTTICYFNDRPPRIIYP